MGDRKEAHLACRESCSNYSQRSLLGDPCQPGVTP